VPRESPEEEWNLDGLREAVERDFVTPIDPKAWLAADSELAEAGLRERVVKAVEDAYAAKVEAVGAPVMRHLEKAVMLQELDRHWREHLAAMDYLRQGIHLRAYAQKNPKQEYKREAFELFGSLLERIKHDTVSLLSRLQVRNEAEIEAQERERERQMALQKLQLQHASPQSVISSGAADQGAPATGGMGGLASSSAFAGGFAGGEVPAGGQLGPGPAGEPVVRDTRKVGRNEPCPCGSGKKFKHCHGRFD
jgi:preprotein translocase subunit SecA